MKPILRKLKKTVGWLILALIAGILVLGTILGIIPWRAISTELRIWSFEAKQQVKQNVAPSSGRPQNSVGAAGACRDNLRRIESAKRAIASKTGISIGNVSRDAVVRELSDMPKCPSGGTYSLGDLQGLPRCSIAGNGTPHNPEDDHLLRNY